MKGKLRQVISGCLTIATLISTCMQPMISYAAEVISEETPPSYELIKDLLDADEKVEAKNLELEVGDVFDVKFDFQGLEIPDELKVKVSFEEAKNEQGQKFQTDHEDTYEAVYYVEPVNKKHPVYQISRKLIVKASSATTRQLGISETEVESDSDSGGNIGDKKESLDEEEADSQKKTEDVNKEKETNIKSEQTQIEGTKSTKDFNMKEEKDTTSEEKILSKEEFEEEIKSAQEQKTVDEKTGLTLSEVLEQGEEKGINLLEMEEGETIFFQVDIATDTIASSTEDVEVIRGSLYRYDDYGLGSYLTYKYTVKFGDVSATAYCVQPSKPGPGDGTYKITKLGDSKTLAKVCYYGTKASGNEGFFVEKYPDFSEGKKFIITHLAAAYANGSSDAFSGANSTGIALAKELYEYCVNQADIPDVAMSFSNDNVISYRDGGVQRTEEITFKADSLQSITMKLPDGVKFHNATTGEVSKAGADVVVSGGTKFYLSAPLTQATDVAASWSSKMKGSVIKDYSAYKITTGSSTQDLALVFGEGVTNEKYVEFKVSWIEQAEVKVIKKDLATKETLAGAIFGVYSDKECKKLITKMPATDKDGVSKVSFIKTVDTVYIKEITAPSGYAINSKIFTVEISENGSTKTVHNQEQMAELTIYKTGEVLKEAKETEAGISFLYEEGKLQGAAYNVVAEEDIITPTGTLVYHKGDVVAENIVTGEDGSATVKNLHLGKYKVVEVTAPKNYILPQKEKTVELTYTGQDEEVIFTEISFKNERQKAGISVIKKDSDNEMALSGAVYGLYAENDIKNVDGTVIVAKDTLIESVTTGEDGTAFYKVDLPIDNAYYIKELQAPMNYILNKDDIYHFKFAYTNGQEAKVKFEHSFTNERQRVRLRIKKQDAKTERPLSGAVFGIYVKEDVIVNGSTVAKAGEIFQKVMTGKEGIAEFLTEIPCDVFYAKELEAPKGYATSTKEIELKVSDKNEEETMMAEATIKEEPISVSFKKSDITTGVELDGATLTVLGEDGEIVDTWTSKKDEPHIIEYLEVGKSYTLREEFAPYGYLKASEVKFTVKDTNEIQKIEMKDEVPKAMLLVNKKGEFLDKVTLVDNAKGIVEHIFEYVNGRLTNVTFEVYAAEDIKAADGVSDVYYHADDLVTTITTDINGIAKAENLPVGKYYVKEIGTAYGYVLDEEPRYVDLTYRDQDTPVVVYDEDWQNNRQKVKINILKKEKDTESVLEGGIFGLYAREDIKLASGKVVLAADEIIELKSTDAEGKITFIADLPIDAKYYVKELYAPDGFVVSNEEQEFTFEYQGEKKQEAVYEFVFENEPTKVQITKSNLTNGEEIEGAKLVVTDKDNVVVDEWISQKEPHLIENLLVGQEYTLTETKPADGYVTAESIIFTVDNIADIQKVEMKDDVTKAEISKQDIAGKEISGAELAILNAEGEVVEKWTSTDKPHYIEMLPIGQYTLVEELAPEGYLIANDVKFEIKDTGEIQKVVMVDEMEPTTPDKPSTATTATTSTTTTSTNTTVTTSTSTTKISQTTTASTSNAVNTTKVDAKQMAEEEKEKVQSIENSSNPESSMQEKRTSLISIPKTGDDRYAIVWLFLSVVAIGGIGGSLWYFKRKKK